MNRYVMAMIAVVLANAGTLRAGSYDVSVRFDPPLQIVPLGSNFTIDIVADLWSPVVGWGLDLNSDNPGVAGETALPAVGYPWITATAPDADGLVGLASPYAPIFGSVSGSSVVLATLSFHADAIGSTNLSLSATSDDLTEGFPLDPFGFGLADYSPGVIVVTPEPAACVLMASFLFLGCRRRPSRPRRTA